MAFSAVTVARTKNRTRAIDLEIVLMYSIGIIGFTGMSNFVVHAFYGETIAQSIGWPAGNLFQLEVAGANLAIGLIGFLGFWRRDFWLPFLIAKTIFSWTAGVAHVIDLVGRRNAASGNAGLRPCPAGASWHCSDAAIVDPGDLSGCSPPGVT